jgi:DNA-binding transcriptional LysR family regulator
VFRRLKTLEKGLGVRLFDRGRATCNPTVAGARLILAAELAGEAFDRALLEIAGEHAELSGVIRFTTLASLAEWVVMPLLADFHKKHPAIRIELVESGAGINLTQREADVTLRISSLLPKNLVGRCLGPVYCVVYASREYLTDHPGMALRQMEWIVPTPDIVPPLEMQWIHRHVPPSKIALFANSSVAGQKAALNHMGLCVLICYLGDAAGLVRVSPPIESLSSSLWLLTHPRLRDVARIKAFMDFLGEALQAQKNLLQGEDSVLDIRSPVC